MAVFQQHKAMDGQGREGRKPRDSGMGAYFEAASCSGMGAALTNVHVARSEETAPQGGLRGTHVNQIKISWCLCNALLLLQPLLTSHAKLPDSHLHKDRVSTRLRSDGKVKRQLFAFATSWDDGLRGVVRHCWAPSQVASRNNLRSSHLDGAKFLICLPHPLPHSDPFRLSERV